MSPRGQAAPGPARPHDPLERRSGDWGLLLWEGAVTVSVLCVAVAAPLDVAFGSRSEPEAVIPSSFYWMIPCDAVALADIARSLLGGSWRPRAYMRYRARYLLPDILGLMIADVVDWQCGGSGAAVGAVVALKASRLARVVFRASRLGRTAERARQALPNGVVQHEQRLNWGWAFPAVAFVSFAFLAHWVACVWIAVLRLEAQPGGGWLGEMGVDFPSYADDSGRFGVPQAERLKAYSLSLRWATSTLLLGPDSVTPTSSIEAIICAAVLLTGLAILVALAQLLSRSASVGSESDRRPLHPLGEFPHPGTKLPLHIMTFYDALNFQGESRKGVEQVLLHQLRDSAVPSSGIGVHLKLLSPGLRAEVLNQSAHLWFHEIASSLDLAKAEASVALEERLTSFSGWSSRICDGHACAMSLLLSMRREVLPHGEQMFRPGFIAEKFYIVLEGSVRLRGHNGSAVMARGTIGDEALAPERRVRLYGAQAEGVCECLVLDRADLEAIMGCYPAVERRWRRPAIWQRFRREIIYHADAYRMVSAKNRGDSKEEARLKARNLFGARRERVEFYMAKLKWHGIGVSETERAVEIGRIVSVQRVWRGNRARRMLAEDTDLAKKRKRRQEKDVIGHIQGSLQALQEGQASEHRLLKIQESVDDMARMIKDSDLDQILNFEVRLQKISMDQEDTLDYMRALAEAAVPDGTESP